MRISNLSETIKFIQVNEPKNGYHLAFSGGKDSIVLYDVAKKSGVTFQSYFCRTSVDPPEILRFIKDNYPEVTMLRPKISMFQLILKKGMLPLRTTRFCCAHLKEYAGKNSVVLTGVRRAESTLRSSYGWVQYDSKNQKTIMRPLLKWSDRQIWQHIRTNKLSYPSLYDEGFTRIGCIGCPMASGSQRRVEFKRWPKFYKAYLNTVKQLMQRGCYSQDLDAKAVMEWWMSDESQENFYLSKKQGYLKLKNKEKNKNI